MPPLVTLTTPYSLKSESQTRQTPKRPPAIWPPIMMPKQKLVTEQES
jgi:hypothetical protein